MNCDLNKLVGQCIKKIVPSKSNNNHVTSIKIYTSDSIFKIGISYSCCESIWFTCDSFGDHDNFVVQSTNDKKIKNKKNLHSILELHGNDDIISIKMYAYSDHCRYVGNYTITQTNICDDMESELLQLFNIVDMTIDNIDVVDNCREIVEIIFNLGDKQLVFETIRQYDKYLSWFDCPDDLNEIKNFKVNNYVVKQKNNRCNVTLNGDGRQIKFDIIWEIGCEYILFVKYI